jgi:arsenite-transporting ATPase
MSTRVILVSGKGGVGKTTVAAATGLRSARAGSRTLVMSFDLAHSLADSYSVQSELFGLNKGQPRPIEDRLAIMEIDLYEELNRQWGDTLQIVSGLLFGGSNLQEAAAGEIGIMPGVEELVALHCLHERYQSGDYDVIVVDCPPTAEALAFVGLVSLLEFYVQKRLSVDRRFCGIARPIAISIDPSWEMFFPEDRHFQVLEQIAGRMSSMNVVLRDSAITTVRLVTNPEKMIVEETKRALMYFSMYGITTDAVVMNRLLPPGARTYSERLRLQTDYVAAIEQDFAPVPMSRAPWMQKEVVGLQALELFAANLYGDLDPRSSFITSPAYRVLDPDREGGCYSLELKLPFAQKDDIDLRRLEQGLSIGIGPFRRVIMLPKVLQPLKVTGAKLFDDLLTINFGAA